MFRFACILLLLATIPLRANLGETVDQCVKRYGRPVGFSEAHAKFPFGTVVFTAGTYVLIVFLHDGKEVGARVTKKDNSAFNDGEIKTILDADTVDAGWTVSDKADSSASRWTRGDKATAMYDHDNHVLIFTSDEMATIMKTIPPAPAETPASSPPTNAPPAGPPPAPSPLRSAAP